MLDKGPITEVVLFIALLLIIPSPGNPIVLALGVVGSFWFIPLQCIEQLPLIPDKRSWRKMNTEYKDYSPDSRFLTRRAESR